VKKSAKEWELDDENKGVRRALFLRNFERVEVDENAPLSCGRMMDSEVLARWENWSSIAGPSANSGQTG
jgi:hypothetical protein